MPNIATLVNYVVDQGHKALNGKVQPAKKYEIFGGFENNATQESHSSFKLVRLYFILF